MRFIVTVQTAPDPSRPGGGLNLSQQVEAPTLLAALDAAKTEIATTLEQAALTATG